MSDEVKPGADKGGFCDAFECVIMEFTLVLRFVEICGEVLDNRSRY